MAAMLGTRVVSDAAQAALATLAVEDPAALEQLRAVSRQEVARAQGAQAGLGSAPGAERPMASRGGVATEAGQGSREGLEPGADFNWASLRNRAACAAAFAAAAVKAKLLAEEEEHHMRSLLTKAVEWQVGRHLHLTRMAGNGSSAPPCASVAPLHMQIRLAGPLPDRCAASRNIGVASSSCSW